ncbi:hypothetical protein FSP39_001806 [Pinctada imbricata]|uniref:Fork-head domain-containing protein n=1 Tax=Pinctada imbricata TaxID=66713 RepID=A0AA88Y9H6_PINIB|nr:hypothetical protein FSP39_001806 [Pinctada imbricata]
MMSMAFCNPGDMDFLCDQVSMDPHDLQGEMERILQNSDFLHSEDSNQGNSAFDFDTNGQNTIDEWISNIHWSDVAKIQQNLMDNSFEIENNNPNLLVNPQAVMPIQLTPAYHSSPKKSHYGHQMTVKSEPQDEESTLKIENVVSLNPLAQGGHTYGQQITEQNNNRISNRNVAQNSPVLVEHLQNRSIFAPKTTVSTVTLSSLQSQKMVRTQQQERVFPKPVYSYSCLIAMALKNSRKGSLPVSEIYNFMTEHFPYFKTAPDGWKSMAIQRRDVYGHLNPAKIEKMEEEIAKHRKKDLEAIRSSMSKPEKLELIEAGKAGPVGGSRDDPPSPEPLTPIIRKTVSKEKKELMEINIMDSNLTLDQPLPELNLQNGIWDDLPTDIKIEPIATTSTGTQPQIVTLSAISSLPSTITIANGNIYQGGYNCSSPLISQQSTTPTSQVPSYIVATQI